MPIKTENILKTFGKYIKRKIKPPKMAVEFLVGATGFEPILAESESDVLPLNYAPMATPIIYALFPFCK